jgi:hypothetical protein
MQRRLLTLLATLSLTTLTAFSTSACDPGVYDEGSPDARVGGNPDAAVGGPDATVEAECEPKNDIGFDGHHFPGQPCQSCHFTGTGGAPLFSMGGTLYPTATGGLTTGGATVVITDANGMVTRIQTGGNGNFRSTKQFAYPIKVKVSLCPDTVPMISEIAAPGDCNSASCHAAGSALGRVHLP